MKSKNKNTSVTNRLDTLPMHLNEFEFFFKLLLDSRVRFIFLQNECIDFEVVIDSKSKLPRDLYPLCVTADCRFVVDDANRMPDQDAVYLVHDLLVERKNMEKVFDLLWMGWQELVPVIADGYEY